MLDHFSDMTRHELIELIANLERQLDRSELQVERCQANYEQVRLWSMATANDNIRLRRELRQEALSVNEQMEAQLGQE